MVTQSNDIPDPGTTQRISQETNAGVSQGIPVGKWALNAWAWIERDLPGPGVFPCKGKNKPLTEHGCLSASRDLDQINEWGRRFPTANIGLATGGGLIVLDIDAAKNDGDTAGFEWLLEYEKEHGELPETLTQTTPNGGAHFFFREHVWAQLSQRSAIANSAGTLGWNVDVRGHHGYVIVSPSSIDGRQYEIDSDADAALLPEALEAKMTRTAAAGAPTGEYKALSDELRSELAPETLRAVAVLEKLGGHSAFMRGDVVNICRPGKDRGTSATVGYVPAGGEAFEARDRIHSFTSSWPGVKLGKNKVEDLEAAFDGDGEPSTASTAGEGNPVLERLLDWPVFWSGERPANDWLCEPWLVAGRGHSLVAAAKVGKSNFMLACAAAMATGRGFLDRPAGVGIDVMYGDGEMTAADLDERLRDLGYGPDTDLSRFHYLFASDVMLDTKHGGEDLVAAAMAVGAQVVVIDGFARFIDGGENDADTLRSFYRYTGSKLKEDGIAWVRCDNTGKDKARGARGTSGKTDDVDVAWSMERENGYIKLAATHKRLSWVPDVVLVDRSEDDRVTYELKRGAKPTLDAAAKRVERLLDKYGVSLDASRRAAKAALEAVGETAANGPLGKALAWRKWQAIAGGDDEAKVIDNMPDLEDGGEDGGYGLL